MVATQELKFGEGNLCDVAITLQVETGDGEDDSWGMYSKMDWCFLSTNSGGGRGKAVRNDETRTKIIRSQPDDTVVPVEDKSERSVV